MELLVLAGGRRLGCWCEMAGFSQGSFSGSRPWRPWTPRASYCVFQCSPRHWQGSTVLSILYIYPPLQSCIETDASTSSLPFSTSCIFFPLKRRRAGRGYNNATTTRMDSRSLRATPSQETLISLMQLEPQPIADTEKELPPLPEDLYEDDKPTARSIGPGHARTTSLGLSGSNHGSIYYCEYLSFFLSLHSAPHLHFSFPRSKLTILSVSAFSNTHPTLLHLRPLHLHHHPPRQHLPHPSRHPLRPRLRILPPPRPRDLPNPAHRAPLRRPPHRRPPRRRPRPARRPPQPKPTPLRRRHPGRARPALRLHPLPRGRTPTAQRLATG